MCNDPQQLLAGECVVFVAGAWSLWYSFRIEAERELGKRLFGKLRLGLIVDLTDGWMKPNQRRWFYRVWAYLITAFFWGFGIWLIVAFPRCP